MVSDGASSNRRFFTSHAIEEYKKSGVTFEGPNISLPGNFICDVPHFLRPSTAKGTRNLEVNSSIT